MRTYVKRAPVKCAWSYVNETPGLVCCSSYSRCLHFSGWQTCCQSYYRALLIVNYIVLPIWEDRFNVTSIFELSKGKNLGENENFLMILFALITSPKVTSHCWETFLTRFWQDPHLRFQNWSHIHSQGKWWQKFQKLQLQKSGPFETILNEMKNLLNPTCSNNFLRVTLYLL